VWSAGYIPVISGESALREPSAIMPAESWPKAASVSAGAGLPTFRSKHLCAGDPLRQLQPPRPRGPTRAAIADALELGSLELGAWSLDLHHRQKGVAQVRKLTIARRAAARTKRAPRGAALILRSSRLGAPPLRVSGRGALCAFSEAAAHATTCPGRGVQCRCWLDVAQYLHYACKCYAGEWLLCLG
jgi:hypothetical protein